MGRAGSGLERLGGEWHGLDRKAMVRVLQSTVYEPARMRGIRREEWNGVERLGVEGSGTDWRGEAWNGEERLGKGALKHGV